MKRNVITNDPTTKSSATIIIDKNGLRVENKNPTFENDDYFIIKLINQCINENGWYHSWHISIRRAKVRKSEERKKIKDILNQKIKESEELIQKLKDTKNILGRWHY